MNDAPDLRDSFASLRRADAASAPGFERVMGATRRRPPAARWRVAVAACVLMSAAAGLIFYAPHPPGVARVHPTPSSPVPGLALAKWRAPTDFLLVTPGVDWWHAIPDLGAHAATGLESLAPIGMRSPAPPAGTERS